MSADGVLTIERLVADCHAAVYRYLYRLTGSAEDAEDLTQQAFLIAQQKLGQLRDPARARGWLLAIARSCFLKNWARRSSRPIGRVDVDWDAVPADIPDDDTIDRQKLQQVLDGLPRDYRVVLLMFYFEGHSYRQIARKLRVPIGTVMSRLARAKSHLRVRLASSVPVARAAGREESR